MSTDTGADTVAHQQARSLRDLTDPAQGPHALQTIVDQVSGALADRWQCPVIIHRAPPETTVKDNYDRLGYAPEAVTRAARYTRYLGAGRLLRSHTSALIPPLLRRLAPNPPPDLLLVCPGIVYRRDAIDRLHTGEPHQVDLWRLANRPLAASDLEDMIATVVAAVLPGRTWRGNPAVHPYTTDGIEIEVETDDGWVEIGECGLAHPAVLSAAHLVPASYHGLAMGLGLDRILMLVKGIADIRLLRSSDPRIAGQMLNLSPYVPVSRQPPIRRDLSVAVAVDTTSEDIGDRVRHALADEATRIEVIEILSETPYGELPRSAVARMGIRPGQKNVLLHLVIRDLTRTLTSAEANAIRDAVYSVLHEGTAHEWSLRAAY